MHEKNAIGRSIIIKILDNKNILKNDMFIRHLQNLFTTNKHASINIICVKTLETKNSNLEFLIEKYVFNSPYSL